MTESICKTCWHKDDCIQDWRDGIAPDATVIYCKAYKKAAPFPPITSNFARTITGNW